MIGNLALKVLMVLSVVYASTAYDFLKSSANCNTHGALSIEVDGKPTSVYIVSTASSTSTSSNPVIIGSDSKSFIMNGGYGIQIASAAATVYSADMFYNFSLLGKEFIYTVNRSAVGCSCNSALYFVSMPAFGQDQNADSGKYGDYYCDANKVGGEYCPEMDVSEANKYTMATTPHKCTSSQGKHWWWCDGAGCGQNVHNANPNAMCPGSNCTINTNNAYTHAIEFQESNGQLSGIKNTLTQGSQSFIYYSCTDSSYLQAMTDHLKNNMVLVMSQWGNTYQTMQWLDGMTGCQGDCDLDGASSTYSDIKINTL